MPNYVEIDLFIRGDSCDLKDFLSGIKKNDDGIMLSILDSYYPMPEDISKTNSPPKIVSEDEKKRILESYINIPYDIHDYPITHSEDDILFEKYGVNNWFDWAKLYWGSKWGDFDCKYIVNEDDKEIFSLQFTMKSAWNVPIIGYKKVFSMFPKLKFSIYAYECGLCWQSGYEFIEGKLYDNWTHLYHGNRGG
jgi:hypothetical protein